MLLHRRASEAPASVSMPIAALDACVLDPFHLCNLALLGADRLHEPLPSATVE